DVIEDGSVTRNEVSRDTVGLPIRRNEEIPIVRRAVSCPHNGRRRRTDGGLNDEVDRLGRDVIAQNATGAEQSEIGNGAVEIAAVLDERIHGADSASAG